MATYQELPLLFAMLDGTFPFRVYVFQTYPNIEARYQKVKYCYTSLFNSDSAEIYSSSSSEILSWNIWCGNKKQRAEFWNTGFMINNNGIIPSGIPIYDFVDRDLLFVNIECGPYPIYQISTVKAASIYRQIREIRYVMYPVDQLAESAHASISHEQKIPTHVLAALIRTAIADSGVCPISMSDFSDVEEFGVTSCFHIFEKESIEQWMSTHKNCPECRASCTNVTYYNK